MNPQQSGSGRQQAVSTQAPKHPNVITPLACFQSLGDVTQGCDGVELHVINLLL